MQEPLSDAALDELDAFDFDLSDEVRIAFPQRLTFW